MLAPRLRPPPTVAWPPTAMGRGAAPLQEASSAGETPEEGLGWGKLQGKGRSWPSNSGDGEGGRSTRGVPGAAARIATEATHADAARTEPPLVPQLKTQAEQMAFLVIFVQGMEKNIQEILQSQKSLERVVETKFHDMHVKVTELTTIVKHLQHEVDLVEIPRSDDEDDEDDDEEESPLLTTTRFNTRLRSVVVPAQETRQTSSSQE
ncbi:hypothetical protein D1007_31735 [Hordeum vulgare]|nr:hypothetical protein D1007_31735 [Hordeum vulgare]